MSLPAFSYTKNGRPSAFVSAKRSFVFNLARNAALRITRNFRNLVGRKRFDFHRASFAPELSGFCSLSHDGQLPGLESDRRFGLHSQKSLSPLVKF